MIPHRKVLRSWLAGLSTRNTALAVALLALDAGLFTAALATVILADAVALKLVGGVVAGFVIGRLFILGHDACHQSYTPHRTLNKVLGRIAFLPSLTPYSLWEAGHNIVHHGYTNLKGFDFVWAPCSFEEFQAMPRWRQRVERLYRSGWAPWLYYLVEMWWLRMYFPSDKSMGARRSQFFWDCMLVSGFAIAWIAGLLAAAGATAQSPGLLLATGFLLPFLFWNAMIGFVVYVHHTHIAVAWYDDKSAWSRAQPFVSTTVHLTFRFGWGTALHHIMEHTAHHVDMGVPLYRLKGAQGKLEEMLPGSITIQPFSWRWYFDTARRCKLYDFRAQVWTDFSGAPTCAPAAAVRHDRPSPTGC
jgi:omega-6 fatty acid desaturase (delta-12 desaturase)